MDQSSIFRFATIRKASDNVTTAAELIVQPLTTLVTDLTAINEGTQTNAIKLQSFNARLQAFISSTAFLKTKAEFVSSQSQSGTSAYYHQLYDNIVARTITKSTNTQVYKLVVEQLKTEHLLANATAHPNMNRAKVKIVLPDSLIASFLGSTAATSSASSSLNSVDPSSLAASYGHLSELQEMLIDARAENVLHFHANGNVEVLNTSFSMINDALSQHTVTESEATIAINEQRNQLRSMDPHEPTVKSAIAHVERMAQLLDLAKQQGVNTFERTQMADGSNYGPIFSLNARGSISIDDAEKKVNRQMRDISKQLFQLAPSATYTLVGDRWVETSGLVQATGSRPNISDNAILVYSHGCWLKFPFQIADLRVVEQQTVGYLPAEIAHINNTQPGELNTRVTRRLKRTEDLESLISEDEVSHETDNQSTEKFGFEREASQVQTEESSWNINASVSASYGPISASVDGGYESSSSSTNSNSASQSYAKEVVQKVVDRVTHKVKRERTTKTIEEFEETVTHVIDNTLGDGPKSYVYRWLNKLTRATLKNYGKRLIFQIDVAHPSHYHLSRMLQEKPTLVLPQDPRTLDIGGVKVDHPDKITRDNYLALGDIYRVKLEAPPAAKMIVSKGFASDSSVRKSEDITLPKGYGAVKGKYNGTTWNNNLIMTIASSAIGYDFWDASNVNDTIFKWINAGIGANEFTFSNYNNAFISDSVSITFFGGPYTINFEIECQLSPDAFKAWQVKTFQAITEAYDNLKSEAEAKFGEFNPNNPGLNPSEKLALIRTELKKEALRKMFRCNPLGISDKYVVGNEYQSDCCTDSANAEKVRFLETVFDWKNLTYELFPYFYSSRDVVDVHGNKVSDNWEQIQKFKDSDPHFEAFLQASYATIRIPVHRDHAKEIAAINFIMNNSIANYEVVPAGAQSLLDELELEPVTMFSYDLDGNELPQPKEIVQLGVFNLPTDLVILECGTQNGVKPIGFPEDLTPPTSDVLIPKQFSPAIIADTCNP